MGVEIRLAVVALVLMAPLVLAEERCLYMIAIPREDPPDLPEENFDSLPWSQRPLIPGPERPDVCMNGYYPITATMGTQIIYMEEEIEGDVPIAKLNYAGINVPYIELPFLSGTYNLLVPVIRQIPENSNEWYLVITQRQDYETPGMQQYMFNVRVDGEALIAGVSLQIVNIDDNAPIIEMFEACQVAELGEPRLTDCVYQVQDADGEISTRFMEFEITSDRNDTEIFYILGENIPGNWFTMYMTLGLNSSLNFETNALHIFRVTALDSKPNTHTVTMMVQVENVEHRPPRWVEIFAVQQFDEKTNQSFTVRAIDGDTGIDKPIEYRLETAPEDTFFRIETIPGGRDGAIFYVDPIDRDYLERDMFQLSIVAFKYDNASFSTAANVIIIVNDINDQIPEPLHEEYIVNILEETALTLSFDEEFGFHDRDTGQNAQYRVHLESVYPPGAHNAFYIAPEVGYQRQTFIMGTLNHSALDYEVEEYQHIELRVVAIDMEYPYNEGVARLYINLINWNDELPIFENPLQTVTFNETEGAGFFVGNVRASDRDIGDRVEHALMGNAADYLHIDKDTGDVYVSHNDSFDFHRQNILFVQIRADDTLMEPYNTETTQLVIQLNDINNTPPTLRLPRGTPDVEENVPEGYVITDEIVATDPDTTAYLRFEIDWETSYATKQGRRTPTEEFFYCVDIETIFPDNNTGSAIGKLVVKEIRYNVTIDFEEFEILYLTVRVRDLNTVLGSDYDDLTYAITIEDMNDNWPIWTEGTLEQVFRVREVSASGVVIGSVLATDIDGPQYNQVRYTISPRLDTPQDLVMIDSVTGQITVNTSGAIDADVPRRYHLYYTVIASDECFEDNSEDCPPDPTFWETEGDITIDITDTNNKTPQTEYALFNTTVYIYENATTGDDVVIVVGSDLDRDEIYRNVSYQIQYAVNARLRDFFAVDLDTGRVYVDYTTDETLDRDGDEPQHRIFINLIDNFFAGGDGNRNQNDTEVLVVLLDVNDNAPELPEPHELSWSISESLLEGVRLEPDIYAPDRDEPDTDNSRVGYAILNLTNLDRGIEVPELFTMIQIANVTGELETAMDLRGYWGTYAIHIQAYDHGIPQQISDEVYDLVIRPYNFHHPVFEFPLDGTMIRVAQERAVIGGNLATVDGEILDNIVATDEDGLEAGRVTFTITGDEEATEYFDVVNLGENVAYLTVKQLITDPIREFYVTIRATDGGTEPGVLSTDSTLHVVFVPTQGDPIFSVGTETVAFIEGTAGMTESHQLPLAEDPKNHLCGNNCHDIFYRIVGGNADDHFAVDPVTNTLFLEKELNREERETHTLTIAASNSLTPGAPLAGATLTVTVNVREADPRPMFIQSVYTAGISTLDTIGRELMTIQATHSENASITYNMDMSTMQVDPSLEGVQYSAFILGAQSGVLALNIQPTASMHGIFEFQVVAIDPAGAEDRAEVKVYLISSLNRVFFMFFNTLQQIEEHRNFVAQTFSTGFGMTCNIDQIVPSTDSNGVALDDVTEVRAHFIRDNVPVPAEEIEQLRSDTMLLRSIQTILNMELLILQDFVTEVSPEAGADSVQLTIYVLAALSLLLTFLCIVLLIAFIIRTRTLSRRLEALSMTKYGSVASQLNRAGIAAPGTNKHATEGSNPIWNEAINAPDFDGYNSDASNDSDLIGVEDLLQFNNDYFPPEDAASTQDIIPAKTGDTVANHNNNFGFSTTPFSSDFANKPFKL